MLHAVIMAGGGGTRFWPRSRQGAAEAVPDAGRRPFAACSMALDRIEALAPPEHTWVVTGEAYRAETAAQLPSLPADRIVGEPCGRDTAPCIGLGAALIARDDPDAVMLMTPADHVIEPVQEFRRAVLVAEQTAEEHPSALVTFGIPPTFPSTGYGYIHRGPEVGRRNGVGVFRVRGFREKPNADLAEQFLASGEYFWNSGIFVWKVGDRPGRSCASSGRCCTAAVQRIADAWDAAEPSRRFALRIRGDGEGQHRLRRDGARPGSAGGAGAVPLGRRRQLAGAGADEPAGRRRQHGPGRALRRQHARTA